MHIPICAFIFRLREFLLIRLVIQFPDLCRAAMKVYARSQYLKDSDAYKKLIKDTINDEINPVKFPQLWRGRDHDMFMETYQEFFAAAAATNQLLDKSILKQVVKSQLKGDAVLTDEFSDKLCRSHSKCKHEAKSMVNGDKLNKGVRRVATIWKRSWTTSSEATSFDVIESDNKDIDNIDTANTTQDNADDDAYQTAKKTLEVTVALFSSSGSSVGSSSTSKTLKRNISSISVGSSGGSDVDASAACAEAKKQPQDGANKVV